MKKLLGILALGLLWCNVGNAEEIPKKYLDKNFIFKTGTPFKWLENRGNWGNFSIHGRIIKKPWSLRYEKNIVRDGKYSIRFETREKECGKGGGSDCSRGKFKGSYGRSELYFDKSLSGRYYKDHGEAWYAWSMYIPEETNHVRPGYTILGQFKENKATIRQKKYKACRDDAGIRLGFQLNQKGLYSFQELCTKKPNQKKPTYEVLDNLLIPTKEMKNKWLDFLVHVNWSFKEDGFIKIWINNEIIYEHNGINSSVPYTYKGKKPGVAFRFGIYNGMRENKPIKPQIVYYDSLRRNKTCEETALWHDCNNLPSNDIKIEGQFKLSWHWVDIDKKANKIIKDEFIVSDLVRFENGKFIIDKLGSSNIISGKYRKKIVFTKGQDEKIIMNGKVNLDYDGSDPIQVVLSPDKNNKSYAGTGVHNDENSDKSENIKLILEPLN